jgi:broad specificity phosphatase PhoE
VDDSPRGRPLSDPASHPAAHGDEQPLVPAGLSATLVLLRHGESTAIVEGRFQGQSDVPLSPVGERQAALAARRLARPHASPALPVPAGPPREIAHSPLARAAATARAVADASAATDAFGHTPTLRADDGFAEIGQGDWEGRLATEIAERWADTLAAWRRDALSAHAPGGEALPEVQARVRAGIDRLLRPLTGGGTAPSAAHPPASLVPGYGPQTVELPWSILVAHDGVFKVTLLTLLGLPLRTFWAFPFALCGISVVEVRDGRVTLRAHNLTDHLAPLLEERALAVSEARERSGAL